MREPKAVGPCVILPAPLRKNANEGTAAQRRRADVIGQKGNTQTGDRGLPDRAEVFTAHTCNFTRTRNATSMRSAIRSTAELRLRDAQSPAGRGETAVRDDLGVIEKVVQAMTPNGRTCRIIWRRRFRWAV